jgi:hypothetical protein
LFSIYVEAMILEAIEGIEEEVRVDELITDARFADDQAMVASTE